jgi:hypothetical protein
LTQARWLKTVLRIALNGQLEFSAIYLGSD